MPMAPADLDSTQKMSCRLLPQHVKETCFVVVQFRIQLYHALCMAVLIALKA